MLVLSRKAGEAIRVGDAIDIVVLGVSKGRVRLGFEAPRDVSVRRCEVPARPMDAEVSVEVELELQECH